MNISENDRLAISTVAVNPEEWIENLIISRAMAAMDEAQRSSEWPQALASAQAAGVAVQDAAVVLRHAVAAGIIKTAAQRQTEIETAPLPEPPPADPATVSISRQQVALEMLAREMVTPTEALALAQTGAAPAWIADLIETLPAGERPVAYIMLTYSTWRRDDGLLATLSALPGAPDIDLDDFFAAAAAR